MDQSNNNTNKKRILIIDDDIYIIEMYANHLRSKGYEVDTATDGNSGYQQMCNSHYDIILLDIMLPEITGTSILREWRKNKPVGSKPPIIILTNYEQNDSNRKDLVVNSDAYLVKASITPRDLLTEIEKLLAV